MKTILNCVFAICFFYQANAQIGAGYMGKRCLLGYGFFASPAIVNSNAEGMAITGGISESGNASTGELAFNTQHEGYLEFAIKNRTSIGASCRYYKTTYDNREPVLVYFTETDPYTGYTRESYRDGVKPTGLYNITAVNYMLYFKFYRRGYIAPWGKYFMIGPVFTKYNTEYDPSKMKIMDLEGKVDFGPRQNSFSKIDVIAGFGRSRILFDRLTLEYGINLGLFGVMTTPGDITDTFLFEEVGFDRIENDNYIERTSKRRMRSINRFNAFLRIGFLLF